MSKGTKQLGRREHCGAMNGYTCFVATANCLDCLEEELEESFVTENGALAFEPVSEEQVLDAAVGTLYAVCPESSDNEETVEKRAQPSDFVCEFVHAAEALTKNFELFVGEGHLAVEGWCGGNAGLCCFGLLKPCQHTRGKGFVSRRSIHFRRTFCSAR